MAEIEASRPGGSTRSGQLADDLHLRQNLQTTSHRRRCVQVVHHSCCLIRPHSFIPVWRLHSACLMPHTHIQIFNSYRSLTFNPLNWIEKTLNAVEAVVIVAVATAYGIWLLPLLLLATRKISTERCQKKIHPVTHFWLRGATKRRHAPKRQVWTDKLTANKVWLYEEIRATCNSERRLIRSVKSQILIKATAVMNNKSRRAAVVMESRSNSALNRVTRPDYANSTFSLAFAWLQILARVVSCH